MSDFDLLIRGDDHDVAADDGLVVAVGPGLDGTGREEIDARGAWACRSPRTPRARRSRAAWRAAPSPTAT